MKCVSSNTCTDNNIPNNCNDNCNDNGNNNSIIETDDCIIIKGRHTIGNPHINCYANKYGLPKVVIGNYCKISDLVDINIGFSKIKFKRNNWLCCFIFNNNNNHNTDVIIGNDVEIQDYCFINPGVVIGDGARILKNSKIISNVDPYAVVAGNPAKKIRNRYTQENIEKLLKIKWWNWSENNILANKFLLDYDIDQFIKINFINN